MTRRTRSAALFTVTAMTGLALSLAIAPTANAAPGDPNLTGLSVDDSSPQAGDLVKVSGLGCFGLDLDPAAADPSAAPAAAAGVGGTVSIRITGPDSFSSTDSATASNDGSWDGVDGITVGDAGTYTVNATCTVLNVGGTPIGYDYTPLSLEVTAAPVPDPGISCIGCDSVNPGGSVTVSGTNFPTGDVSVTLAGYATQSVRADAGGGVAPVTIVIRADQAAGTLNGAVTASPSGATVPFSVVVVAVQAPGGNADGDVPPVTTTTPSTTTGTGSSSTTTRTGGTNYSNSKPSLPATGVDSLWPGVIGASLLVAGVGLVWAGRRRPEGVDAAV